MKLRNKIAIVTGGARGIGLAVARRYVAEGAKVVIGDVDRAAGAAAAQALGEASCRFVAADVGDAASANQPGRRGASRSARSISWSTMPGSSAADFLDLQAISTACCG